ncbi:hypothetical protein LQG66_28580 [Bradyrhizobium ontarionense]|uniref:AAA+ ATPase domain-containing protein n=1 Tax=Bradyrhizobium ontarionense TaxID=2898149 RepID=A0ABY3R8D5_9BRAD|nr:hypothetical protein [Bradyrhizobium sp. A19]UFZ03165.1 hypothetical protein LQG66_28580 [Bradyrhizobium sp. A19]
MASATIHFSQMRPHRGDQKVAFEELTRQLIVAAPPAGHQLIENRGQGADGGVEILVRFPDGTYHGWQSKFFLDTMDDGQIGQIKDSFKAALANFPTLARYVVVIPRNLGGSGVGTRDSERARWTKFTTWAAEKASEAGRTVALDLWDETELIRQLTLPSGSHAGVRTYWFDQVLFTDEWFRQKFDGVQADLNERFSADDHVDVSAQRHLDVLCRNEAYLHGTRDYCTRIHEVIPKASNISTDSGMPESVRAAAQKAASEFRSFEQEALSMSWVDAPRIDLEAMSKRMSALYDDMAREWRVPTDEDTYRELMHLDRLLEAALVLPCDPELLARPVLLLAGTAGSGKSHALAHAVQQHLQSGAPAVMLLGQYFERGDPWPQIALKLGLDRFTQDEILGALQAAALAAGRPCLIAIDAINEAEDAAIWRSHLLGLLRNIERFDRLAVVLSCRTTYESYCLPDPHNLTRRTHQGFAGNFGQAAKEYLDKRGIDRPAMPFLDPEFTNPLFLSTACKALVAEGRTAFPLGLDGLSDVFRFYVTSVQKNLIRKGFDRFDPNQAVVWNALQGFAHELLLKDALSLPRDDARAFLEKYLYPPHASEHRNTFLFKLEDEGLLRWAHRRDGVQEITFTFQRFSDHFCASAILQLVDSAAALAVELGPRGSFAHLTNPKTRYQFTSVIEALMVQVPEKFGVELVHIGKGFAKDIAVPISSFIESLKLRVPSAVTAKTVALVEHLRTNDGLDDDDFYSTLIQLASHPGHLLNADYLHKHLTSLPLPDRDAIWSAYLVGAMDRESPVSILIDWAASAEVSKTDSERLRLVALALGWILTTTDREVRDAATKALTAMFYRAPLLIAQTIFTFGEADDLYLRERVLGAAYGALLHIHDKPAVLGAAAEAAYNMVFSAAVPERHAVVRHYAQGIVDLASRRTALPKSIDLKKCRPPFATKPITTWPSRATVKKLDEDAYSIMSSVVGHYIDPDNEFSMAGDFGTYTMSAIGRCFSEVSLRDGKPQTAAMAKAQFWKEIGKLGRKVSALGTSTRKAREAYQAAQAALHWETSLPPAGYVQKPRPSVPALKRKFEDAEKRLLAELTPELRARFKSEPPYEEHGDAQIKLFSRQRAQRWVAWRAVDLGWSKKKHEHVERKFSGWGGRRTEHVIERIGKKYQWIAYWELVGYLIDHHWYVDWEKKPEILQNIELFDTLDIDVSFLLTKEEAVDLRDPRVPPIGLPATDFKAVGDALDLAWISTTEDLPHLPSVVERKDRSGARWWLVKAYRSDEDYLNKLQTKGPLRTGQFFVELIILKPETLPKLFDKIRGKDISGSDLVEHEHTTHRLFGLHAADLLAGVAAGPLLNAERSTGQFGYLTTTLSGDRGEYDQSDAVEMFAVPSEQLARALQLRPENPWSPGFVTMDGTLAFFDTRPTQGRDGAALINAELLTQALRKWNLTCAWVLIAEKDGGVAGDPRRYEDESDRHSLGGLWWIENGEWKGDVWAAPMSRKEEHSPGLARRRSNRSGK